MFELMQKFEELDKMLGEKESEKLQIKLMKRLVMLLIENNIEDEYLIVKIEILSNDLRSICEGNKAVLQRYKKNIKLLTENIRKKYGYAPKGTYISIYMSLGLAIGSALGAAFIALNPVFISVGLGMGIAIGTSIGSLKESEASKEGKLY